VSRSRSGHSAGAEKDPTLAGKRIQVVQPVGGLCTEVSRVISHSVMYTEFKSAGHYCHPLYKSRMRSWKSGLISKRRKSKTVGYCNLSLL
jgi:hypothetical protein